MTTVGLDRPADIVATTMRADIAGTTVAIDLGGDDPVVVTTPLAGWFNAENAVLAAAMANHVGWSAASIASGIAAVGAVAGRFERVEAGQPFTVVVDYAHTPEAMALVVEAVRSMTDGRIIALGGAGGDRDREKRPAMGAALGAADLAVVTSDNPRSEDPGAIADAVASGVADGTAMIIELDRRRAIRAALAAAQPGDVVLLLGRGHEPLQDLGDRKEPFADRDVAAEVLAEMMRSR